MIQDLELDEVHVISDLHLGGTEGFQIFASGSELAGLIRHLAERPSDRKVGLVINGDFVDFLAEPGAAYFDPLRATEKLDRLFEDRAFAPVWKALRDYLSKPSRYLAIVLGNHDLELALPWVRRHLTDRLCQGRDSRRGRIIFALDGAGFRCNVAGSSVLCLHGNEVDTWNLVDYERLRTEGRDRQFGLPAERWIPNSGTQLVIEVMNDIKRKYPFVDLLKPETEGVVPILVALDQAKAGRLARIVSVASRLTWDKARHLTGFLSAEDEDRQEVPDQRPTATKPDQALELLLGKAFSFPGGERSEASSADALLTETERHLLNGEDPLDLLQGQPQEEMLGYFGAALKWIRGKNTAEILLEALKPLREDPSFDLAHEDQTFKRLDGYLGDQFDFVVAGHTHLERAMPRRKGNGFYYNCGTWAGLIRLSPEVLSSPTSFQPVFDAIRAGSLEALDVCPGLILRKPAVVSVWQDNGRVRSALRRVELEDGGIFLKTIHEA